MALARSSKYAILELAPHGSERGAIEAKRLGCAITTTAAGLDERNQRLPGQDMMQPQPSSASRTRCAFQHLVDRHIHRFVIHDDGAFRIPGLEARVLPEARSQEPSRVDTDHAVLPALWPHGYPRGGR